MKKLFWLLIVANILLLGFIIYTFEQDTPPESYLAPALEGNIELYQPEQK